MAFVWESKWRSLVTEPAFRTRDAKRNRLKGFQFRPPFHLPKSALNIAVLLYFLKSPKTDLWEFFWRSLWSVDFIKIAVSTLTLLLTNRKSSLKCGYSEDYGSIGR